MRVPPDLGPRTFGELLDGAFVVYRRHFGYLLLLALLVSAPALIGSALFADVAAEATANYVRIAMNQPVGASPDELSAHFGRLIEALLELQLPVLAGALLQALSRGGTMALAAILVHAILAGNERPAATVALRRMLPRLPAIVLGPFVLQLGVSFLICCCLPAYVVVVVLLLAQPVIAMLEVGRLETRVREGMADGGALGSVVLLPLAYLVVIPAATIIDSTVRSIGLTWGARSVARGTAFTFALYMFGALLTGAVMGVGQYFDQSGAVGFWAQHYGELLVLPAYGVGTTLWYFDLRVRREGLDLEAALHGGVVPA